MVYSGRIFIILLLLINFDNNLDRLVYALNGPSVQHDFHMSEGDYAHMVAAFQFAFALTSLASGLLIDRIGTRRGMALSIAGFSLAQIGHAFATSVRGFGAVRVLLAIFEAPTYPSTLKALAATPPESRAAAAGWVHFGVMLGPIVAPLAVPVVAARYGWRAAFVASGILGLILLVPWLLAYRDPAPAVASAPPLPTQRPSALLALQAWLGLLRRRQLWACVTLQALPNPAWWFLIYWLPKFLDSRFGLRGAAISPLLTFVYVLAALGALLGGRLSGVLLRRGLGLNASRKLVLLMCGLAMPLVYTAVLTTSPWLAALVIGLAAALHQTWTATGAAIVGDLFPARRVGSVVGISSFFGSLAGVAAAEITGWVLDVHPGNYLPMFGFVAVIYLLATGVVQLCTPNLRQAEV